MLVRLCGDIYPLPKRCNPGPWLLEGCMVHMLSAFVVELSGGATYGVERAALLESKSLQGMDRPITPLALLSEHFTAGPIPPAIRSSPLGLPSITRHRSAAKS